MAIVGGVLWTLGGAMLGSAAPSPENAAPFANLEIAAGSSASSAIDLRAHFEVPAGAAVDYEVSAVGLVGGQAALVEAHVVGPSVTLVAPSTSAVGKQELRVRACLGGVVPAACADGNTFTVTVVAPRHAALAHNPTGFAVSAAGGLAGLRAPAAVEVALVAPAGSGPVGDVAWYLDGARVQQGASASLLIERPGVHTVEAWLVTPQGPTRVSHTFTVAPLAGPAIAGPEGDLAVLAGALGLAGAAGLAASARLRRPLLLTLVGGLYPRLNPESLLDHFTRGALYQLIKDQPGVHFGELRKRTGISHGAAVHHLRVLEKAGYIRVRFDGSFTRYFTTERVLERESYGFSDFERAVFAAVVEKPGISQGELAVHLARSHASVSRAVGRLVQLGYITAGRSMRKRVLTARPGAAMPERAAGAVEEG